MSAKGSGTQGYRYLMSILSGLCRGPVDELVEIQVGDKEAWNGAAADATVRQINAPNLFGGDDKEGGIQGPFSVYMGADNQVLPGSQGGLPGVKESIGGLVPQMRGVVTVWFDGMVAAMSPYLKTWKFRVRRTTNGWFGGQVWFPAKARIVLGGDNMSVTTNRVNDFPITTAGDTFTITFTRNGQDGDTFTINGLPINLVADQPDSGLGDDEVDPDNHSTAKTIKKIANKINSRSTTYKATATYTADTLVIKPVKAAMQIRAANAAHIIYECFTDPLWGRGQARSRMDEYAFVGAANTLFDEGFGLCIGWYRKEEIEAFIQKVCDLVGGITYTDRRSGKTVFRLIRNDYKVEDLFHFTPESGLLGIDDDDSASSDNSYNEIIGTSRDPVSNLDFQVRAQNPASRQSLGAVSSLDQDYKGIPTKALLQRVVLRDLRGMASGLKRYTVRLDRRAWEVTPGSVIRISHPGRGIANLLLRVAEIDDGNMINGEIKIKGAIDVFGLPATAYQAVVDNGWIAPSKVATPAPYERLVEASYRDAYRIAGAGQAQAVLPGDAMIGQVAVAPNATSPDYDLLTKAEGEADYTDRARGPFTGNARLSANIGALDTVLPFTKAVSFDADNIGQALLIDDELVRLDSIDGDTMTVARGVGDTVPQAHTAGALLWTIDDDLVNDQITYTAGETVYAKVLTRTSSDLLDPEAADEQSVTLVGRIARPYPPAKMRVNGTSVYSDFPPSDEPLLTWETRNRITQADHMVGHTEASVAPEEGQKVVVKVYKGDDLLSTHHGIEGNTWTYTKAMQTADSAGGLLRVVVASERDGLESWQGYSFEITLGDLEGWGYDWGSNWGG